MCQEPRQRVECRLGDRIRRRLRAHRRELPGSRLYIVDRASGALLREVVLGGIARRVEISDDGIAVITNEGEPDGWVDFVR
jgi:hypothetical protein